MDAFNTLENLNKVFGFCFPENFCFDNQNNKSAEKNAFSQLTINEKEPFEIVSDDSIFVVPTEQFKRETSEETHPVWSRPALPLPPPGPSVPAGGW